MKNCTIQVAKIIQGDDQLRSYCEANLRLCFRTGKNLVFSRRGSYLKLISHDAAHFLYLDSLLHGKHSVRAMPFLKQYL